MKQAYTIFYRFPEKLISSTCTLYNQRRQSAVYISQSLDAALSAPGMKLSLGVVDVRRHSAVLRGCCACLAFSSPRLELGAPPDDRVVDRFLPTAGTWSVSRRPRRRSFSPHGWNLERLQTTSSSIVRLPPHGVNRCRPSLLPMLPSHMLTARHNRPCSRYGPCSPPVQPMFACCTDV